MVRQGPWQSAEQLEILELEARWGRLPGKGQIQKCKHANCNTEDKTLPEVFLSRRNIIITHIDSNDRSLLPG